MNFSLPKATNLLRHFLNRDAVHSSASTPPKPALVKDPPPPIFALIIGINKYESVRVTNLHGAVSDANDMESYLRDNLKVPSDQIRNLRDGEATRAAIIQAFIDIREDARIREGDAIIIFYAGHGGETPAPRGWESEGNKTQFIIPCDMKTKDHAGNDIHGIPDRTFAALLNRLSDAKGNNISVIFDCCHSGSSTRSDEMGSENLPRFVELPEDDDIPDYDLDEYIWRTEGATRGAYIAPGFARTGLLSHVLLAACGPGEFSLEKDKRGVFTEALLKTLRIVGADKLTYKDLLKCMPALPSQHPRCEGMNQNRILFNARTPSVGPAFYLVSIVDGDYVLEAGASCGISEGAIFTIYRDQETPIKSSPLGVLYAKNVKSYTTTLSPPVGTQKSIFFDDHAYAVQNGKGEKEDLLINVAAQDALSHVFIALASQMQHPGSNDRMIQFVELDKNPHLRVALEDGHVIFQIMDSLVTKYGLSRIPHTTRNNVDDIYPVVQAAAHFRWYADLTSAKNHLQNQVNLLFYEVRRRIAEYDEYSNPLYDIGENLNVDDEVHISEDPSKIYAFKIVNNSRLKLYPSLFYFDNSSFAISLLYAPPFGNKSPDAPLPPNSTLTIGHGSIGQSPRIFRLPAGQDLDVGFMKLFITTSYVDYTHIAQASPFSSNRGSRAVKSTPEIWDTLKIPVIQKKGHSLIL